MTAPVRRVRSSRRPERRFVGSPARGFTLVELVVSMAIMSILMIGLASAVVIVGKAMPERTSLGLRLATAAQIADQIAQELRTALWIREHASTSVEFSVPDRDGDGLPERIRYAWSGVAGTPLTRQYNGGNAVNVASDVYYFNLDYFTTSRSETIPGAPVESAEMVLQSSTNRLFATYFTIKEKAWFGQNISPSLPADAIAWKISRVQFRARYRGATKGVVAVQIRPVADGGNTPESTVLEEAALLESSLGASFGWQEIGYAGLSGLVPGKKYCLLLACQTNDADLGDVEYDYWSGFWSLSTTNAGGSWTYSSNSGMYHYIYGTYTTPGAPLTIARSYFTGARITLQPTSEPASRVVSSLQTVNGPELLVGWWQTGFDVDPTLDHNGDGAADWTQAGGGSFDTSAIQVITGGGLPLDVGSMAGNKTWSVSSTITTNPSQTFQTLTTIAARCKATSTGGTGAVLAAKVDSAGGLCGMIAARLTLQGNSTQTLQVGYKTDDATTAVIKTIEGLPNGYVDLRLVIEPNSDTCNVKANGVDYGSFRYVRYSAASAAGCVSILNSSNALFDFISVRVSE